jgi:cyclopropane fatty-acyl-phospholipid synthase-like methyltransferase
MRILDLGCGRALSSIFFAREFGAQVWAADLWIKPTENWRRIEEAGLSDQVFPLHVEAHQLPFAAGFFDAIVSVDAYHYFGTDDCYIGYITRFLKPDARLAIVVPGLVGRLEDVAEKLKPYVNWEFWSFHGPAGLEADAGRTFGFSRVIARVLPVQADGNPSLP